MNKFSKRRKIKITDEKKESYNFKEAALTKMAKRQLLVTLLSILGVTVISLGSAYAVFTSISKSADYNVIKVGTLNIDFGEDSSNTINLSDKYPMSDEEGLKLTPYVFSIKNTGSLAADYEVFIQDDTDMISQDNCSNNQLNKDYIRYKLDTGSPTNLSSIADSNYKIASGSLGAGQSVTYTLYVWIREGVGNDVLGKHYHGKIVVNGVNMSGGAADTILSNLGENGGTYNDGIDTFITGTDPNNYIWYSGKLWRAVSVNNEEMTTKLVTQWNISAIPYSSGSAEFEGSYMEEWLNDTSVDGFLGNLREPEKFIKMDSVWNATMDSRYLNDMTTRPAETAMITNAVGLLNGYEYRSSYHGTTSSNGYLNTELSWWTLTPRSSSKVWYIYDIYGGNDSYDPSNAHGVRPSINLKSSVKIVDGDGTVNNPYRLSGDNDIDLSGTLLNVRYSGEYIRFGTGKNNLYRIVSHENGIGTKITSADVLRGPAIGISIIFGSNATFSSTNTIGTFLNNDYLNTGNGYLTAENIAMIEDNTTWYLGTVDSGVSYKLAKYTNTTDNILTSSTTTAKVGLLRLGELMAGQFNDSMYNYQYWLLTPSSTSSVRSISLYGGSEEYNYSYSKAIFPTMNLKSNVQIVSGTGIKSDPFVLTLGS